MSRNLCVALMKEIDCEDDAYIILFLSHIGSTKKVDSGINLHVEYL